jgi:hypothetical protein
VANSLVTHVNLVIVLDKEINVLIRILKRGFN